MVRYLEVFQLIWSTCKQEWQNRGPSANFVSEFFFELKEYFCLQAADVFKCLIFALVFTIFRREVTKRLLQPISRSLNFTSKGQRNFPESAFKFIVYLAFYVAECHLLFQKYPEFLTDTQSCWEGWTICLDVPSDLYGIYIAETGFYFHGIYATLFLDVWRDDSIVMLLHHLLTIALLLFSLAIRYHRIGLVVLFLHDIADVCLELTKVSKCFHEKKEQRNSLFRYVTLTGFLSFATAWIYCRIYLYPKLVLYSTGHAGRSTLPDAPFYFFFNGMLWLLFCMNIFWSYYIVLLIYRILTGKSKQIEDTRETNIDVNEVEKKTDDMDTKAINGSISKENKNQCIRSYVVKNDYVNGERNLSKCVDRKFVNGSDQNHSSNGISLNKRK